MPDWIDSFLADTEGLAVESFRLWAGITTLTGALERRCYCYTDKGILYPNFYTILVGTPGAGKSIMINQAKKLWGSVNDLKVGPDNPTRRSFLDCLQKSVKTVGATNGHLDVDVFCAMSVASAELGVLISKYDPSFVNDLSHIWDNPDKYHAPRATSDDVEIEKPTVNLLAAAAPDFLGELFPDIAWGQGLTSRLLFIYGTGLQIKNRNAFARRVEKSKLYLIRYLREIFLLRGEFLWDDDAQDAMNSWINSGQPPVPTYEKLKYYNERRTVHVFKLAMVSSVSRHQKLTVSLFDFERALRWLLEAEATMPNVFRAINQKTDQQILQDLHRFLWDKYNSVERKKRQPIPDTIAYDWLGKHTTSDKVNRLFDLAVKSGYLKKDTMFKGCYTPQTLDGITDLI